jgi:NADPH-dependent FMN reductase
VRPDLHRQDLVPPEAEVQYFRNSRSSTMASTDLIFRTGKRPFSQDAAAGGTERHSLVLEHALRPMFSYLHAIVAPTGVYAATEDFGAQHDSVGLTERIRKAAADFARLLHACGPRTRRDVFAEELTEMQHLLSVED